MTTYPEYLISTYKLSDDINITLRAVKPDDVDLLQNFFRHLSSQSKHSHFQGNFKELSSNTLKRLTQIDYSHEMVLVAIHTNNDQDQIIGLAQYATTSKPEECEVLVIVADDWKSKGIATQLMNRLIEISKNNHIKKLIATIPAINASDLAFAKSLGFVISDGDDPVLKNVTKLLS